MTTHRLRTILITAMMVAPALTAGCGSESVDGFIVVARQGGQGGSTPTATPLGLEVTPAAGAADQPASVEIGTTVTGGTVNKVTLVDDAGTAVGGSLRADASSWVPDQPLTYAKAYTATVTATSPSGQTITKNTTFTTSAKPGGTRVGTGLYLRDGATYGVAMPIVVEFESDVPAESRAAIEHRVLVTSEPAQTGAWRWFSPRALIYRPQSFWQTGTKLTVRSALGGLPIGARYGDKDRSATATIGRDLHIEVDNATKQMTVFKGGEVIKQMPVSLGKPSTPSSSGSTVIIEKAEHTVFDTTATDGANGYRTPVDYAQRLTWGGEFIHAAPWSVGDQGKRNVSHGCVNVSTGNASWLFDQTMIGDLVTTKGTERKLDAGNGWTVWNMTWEEYTSKA